MLWSGNPLLQQAKQLRHHSSLPVLNNQKRQLPPTPFPLTEICLSMARVRNKVKGCSVHAGSPLVASSEAVIFPLQPSGVGAFNKSWDFEVFTQFQELGLFKKKNKPKYNTEQMWWDRAKIMKVHNVGVERWALCMLMIFPLLCPTAKGRFKRSLCWEMGN